MEMAELLSNDSSTEKIPRRSLREKQANLRQCLVCRENLPVERLVRFVIGPDRSVVPDIEGRLPGRGLWLHADRTTVQTACENSFFSKTAKIQVSVEEGLDNRVELLLTRRCLDILGLTRRSGVALAGFEKVRVLLESNQSFTNLIARDAGRDIRRKLSSLRRNLATIDLFSGAELGNVFGRDRTVIVAVLNGGLASLLTREVRRLQGFRNSNTTLEL